MKASIASIMNRFFEARPQPAAFWGLAKEIQKSIQTFVDSGGPSASYNLIGANVAKWAAPRVMAVDKRPTLFSNFYGMVNISEKYGSLRVRDCVLTFNSGEVGPLLHLESVVLVQQLNVSLSGSDLDPDFWNRLRVAARKRLESAIGASEAESRETPSAVTG